MTLKLLLFPFLLAYLPIYELVVENNRYLFTKDGPVIEWSPDVKLKWSDFKARNKVTKGFSVATSTCGFGYEGEVKGDNISINVFVRFYCNNSWKNPGYHMNDVLEHEQLHFDICELYGRKFYREVVKLRKSNRLTEKSLEKIYNELVEEYNDYQDIYDAQTGHSTKTMKQLEWNNRVAADLNSLAHFANYKEY